MVSYGLLWSLIVPYGPIWPHMVPYGPVWSCMAPYGPVWSQIVQCIALLTFKLRIVLFSL